MFQPREYFDAKGHVEIGKSALKLTIVCCLLCSSLSRGQNGVTFC